MEPAPGILEFNSCFLGEVTSPAAYSLTATFPSPGDGSAPTTALPQHSVGSAP